MNKFLGAKGEREGFYPFKRSLERDTETSLFMQLALLLAIYIRAVLKFLTVVRHCGMLLFTGCGEHAQTKLVYATMAT